MYRASKNNDFPTSFGCGLLQGSFLKFWVDKNYMTSNMFCFTMMSLVISGLSFFRLAEIRRKESSMKVLFICQVFAKFEVRNFLLSLTGYELTYCDLGNARPFSFFTMQFFPATQKIAVPRYKFFFVNRGTKTKLILAVTIKTSSIYVHHFLWRQLCFCCTWIILRQDYFL